MGPTSYVSWFLLHWEYHGRRNHSIFRRAEDPGEDLFGELPDVEELPGPPRGMLAGVELEGRVIGPEDHEMDWGNMVVLDDDEESGTRDVTTMTEKPNIKDIER